MVSAVVLTTAEATFVAACIAGAASLLVLVFGQLASRRTEMRAAHRVVLEPHLTDLGRGTHQVAAGAVITRRRALRGQAPGNEAQLARDAVEVLKKKRLEVKYILPGIDEPLRVLTRGYDWTATYKDHKTGDEYLEGLRNLTRHVDRTIERSYRLGRPPSWRERRSLDKEAAELRSVWDRRFDAGDEEPDSLADRVYRRAHLTGSFRLRSGASSREYFDKYLFESDPAMLREIAEQMVDLIPTRVDALAGLELGGVPVATSLSQLTGIPTLFVRKQAKTYGTCRLAEGGELAGRRLVIVEDVVTSAGQIIESVGRLRELGAIVSVAVCVIDREAGGAANLGKISVELRSLLTSTELKAAASRGGATAQPARMRPGDRGSL